jgi:hypothetical protein
LHQRPRGSAESLTDTHGYRIARDALHDGSIAELRQALRESYTANQPAEFSEI